MEYKFPLKTEFHYKNSEFGKCLPCDYPFPIEPLYRCFKCVPEQDIEYHVFEKYPDRAVDIYKYNFDDEYFSLYEQWLSSPDAAPLKAMMTCKLYEDAKKNGYTGNLCKFMREESTAKKLYEELKYDFESDAQLEEQLEDADFLWCICNYLKLENKYACRV